MQSHLWRARSEKESRAERHVPFGREKIDPEGAGSVRSARCPLCGACNRSRRSRPGRLRYLILCRRLLAVNLCGILQLALLYAAHGSHRMRGAEVHRPALRCTRIHGFRVAAVFHPNFYPKRRRGGIEMSFLLVTAANRSGCPGCVTSLPSWSCGFDSRRPLQFTGLFDSLFSNVRGSSLLPGRKPAYAMFLQLNCNPRT
jgi:hypothetical protein